MVFDKWSYFFYIINYIFLFNNVLCYRDRLFGLLSGFKDEKVKNLYSKKLYKFIGRIKCLVFCEFW